MNRPRLHQTIKAKRAANPITTEEAAQGFRGWYSSKYLPHFDSSGAQQFITYRLADSVPLVRQLEWRAVLKLQDNVEKLRRVEGFLDSGFGRCHLRDSRIAQIVQDNLWHYDGRAYRLLAWSIMPNHVHVLIEQWQKPLGEVLHGWKSYTAREANRILGCKGSFWAEDYFDRFIRDEAHFRKVVGYIEKNAVKAGLAVTPEKWQWSSAPYRSKERHLSNYPSFTAAPLKHPTADRVPPFPTNT